MPVLPPSPLLQIVPDRVEVTLQRIEKLIWSTPKPIRVEFAGNQPEFVPLAQARLRDRQEVRLPFTWGRLYDHGWFRVEFPPAEGDRPWFFRWEDRGEGTLYIGGEPYGGFDTCHAEWPLPAGVTEGWIEGLCLQRGIWGGKRLGLGPDGAIVETAAVLHRNDEAWNAYHDLRVLFRLIRVAIEDQDPGYPHPRWSCWKPPLHDLQPHIRRALRAIDEACAAFESGGVTPLRRRLADAYASLRDASPVVRCVLTGHAHIDLAWLWTESAGDYKAVHTFANALRMMELYPEFTFGYSQSASYEAVARRAPGLIDAVRRRHAEGRWEAPGASYVESDTVMACGEALARGIDLGHVSFRETVGASSHILWLPDVFGYTACLPQVLRQSGVTAFFTTKLTWSAITRFPHSAFLWRGHDGAEVTAYVTQTCGYNGSPDPAPIRYEARHFAQADVLDDFLMPVGIGDGGGGPTPEMCESARRLTSLLGVPPTRWGRITDFFHTIEQARERLPVYQGELYLEYHRGVFTTHGDLKSAFRAAERGLQVWEAAHALAARGPIDTHPWKRVVFAQFHDIIPGSSVLDVYAEHVPELAAIADRGLDAARATLATPGGVPCLFNPLPLPRIESHAGRAVALPPLACVAVDTLPTLPIRPAEAASTRLASDRVDARFDDRGRVIALSIDGHAIELAAPAVDLWMHPDHPSNYDAWDIDRHTLELGATDPGEVAAPTASVIDGIATLRFQRRLGARSSAAITFRLHPARPVLEVELDVDWREEERLLKAIFPTRYTGRLARYGSPFGSDRRPQVPGSPTDEAKWEVHGSRWAIVGDDNEHAGLTVVTEAKYGFSCRDGRLGLSLLRAAETPWAEADRSIARRSFPTKFSDTDKRHLIRFALARWHAAAPRTENPAALADLLFTPILPITSHPLASAFQGLIGGESLVPSWCRPLPGGAWTLRLHETLGRSGSAKLHLALGTRAEAVDLLGHPRPHATPTPDGTFPFRPYEILSFTLSPPSP